MQLALYTFGIFERPAADPAIDGFHELNDRIFVQVDGAPGLIARSGYADEPGPESWGDETYPRFYVERGDGWSPATLSLWTGLEAAFGFIYFGLHAEALRRGREWFRTPEWPPLALWWHDRAERPNWAEAVVKHEHLHDHGPGPEVFTFRQAYDHGGTRVHMDKQRIEQARQG